MTIKALFVGEDADWSDYDPVLNAAFEALPFDVALSRDHAPADTDYIVMGGSNIIKDFAPFTRAKALLRLWAGVEDIVRNDTITMPITRMVGGGLDQGMVEWVTAHVLRHHIGMDRDILNTGGIWHADPPPPLAADRKVAILGLGALGTACAGALTGLGFDVTGWSRTPKTVPGLRCLSGDVGDALAGCDIAVLLLPLTPQTKNILNTDTIARLSKGAFILNPGRGPLIDDDALLAALETGQIAHATLDTFRVEPLPKDHAFWAHPRITVTPHIASATRPAVAANVIAQNILRGQTGQPFLHVVDRAAGY